MGESLTEQCRVSEEGLRVVKLYRNRRELVIVTDHERPVDYKEAPANYVPAAAVKHRGQALSGITGRKGRVGGLLSQM